MLYEQQNFLLNDKAEVLQNEIRWFVYHSGAWLDNNVVKHPVQHGLGIDHIAVVVDLRIHLRDVGLVISVVALMNGIDQNVT